MSSARSSTQRAAWMHHGVREMLLRYSLWIRSPLTGYADPIKAIHIQRAMTPGTYVQHACMHVYSWIPTGNLNISKLSKKRERGLQRFRTMLLIHAKEMISPTTRPSSDRDELPLRLACSCSVSTNDWPNARAREAVARIIEKHFHKSFH